jgi:hypothetical protein
VRQGSHLLEKIRLKFAQRIFAQIAVNYRREKDKKPKEMYEQNNVH